MTAAMNSPASWGALVSAADLNGALNATDLCVLDCRFDLGQPALGMEQYRLGHIPGAHYANLDTDLAGPRTGSNGRHPLPEPKALTQRLRDWGVSKHTRVVAYDASQGSYAARAWWLLRWLGHDLVSVLDGGWDTWLAGGYAQSTQVPALAPGDFATGLSLQGTVSVSVLASSRAAGASGAHLLLDARAPDRYEGRNETIDPIAGHIPGAINRFWKQNLAPDGRFKDPASLRSEYQALLSGRTPGQVICQCGSGVTACHDLLAMHVAGMEGAALYPGSWSEWISDSSRPVVTGPNP